AGQLLDATRRRQAVRAVRIAPVLGRVFERLLGFRDGFIEGVTGGDDAGKIGKRDVEGAAGILLNERDIDRHSQTRSTKLSTTFFSPAFSNTMVSLLPSILVTLP